jgi:hypothetical protein
MSALSRIEMSFFPFEPGPGLSGGGWHGFGADGRARAASCRGFGGDPRWKPHGGVWLLTLPRCRSPRDHRFSLIPSQGKWLAADFSTGQLLLRWKIECAVTRSTAVRVSVPPCVMGSSLNETAKLGPWSAAE